MTSDEFDIFTRTVFEPSDKTFTDIGAGDFGLCQGTISQNYIFSQPRNY